jgi:hypothetical protein
MAEPELYDVETQAALREIDLQLGRGPDMASPIYGCAEELGLAKSDAPSQSVYDAWQLDNPDEYSSAELCEKAKGDWYDAAAAARFRTVDGVSISLRIERREHARLQAQRAQRAKQEARERELEQRRAAAAAARLAKRRKAEGAYFDVPFRATAYGTVRVLALDEADAIEQFHSVGEAELSASLDEFKHDSPFYDEVCRSRDQSPKD